MPDQRAQAGAGQLTGVFVVGREIPEIGARVGDRIVLRPWHPTRPFGLVRHFNYSESRSVFNSSCRLDYTDPPTMAGLARRLLEEGVSAKVDIPGPAPRFHLSLVP